MKKERDRQKYVFSFRSSGSVFNLCNSFKVSLMNARVKKAETFTIHDCRRVAL
jgi:hypothetical protein